MNNPIGPTMTVTRVMMYRVMREPYTSRLKISRPYSSVPNQCAAPGACKALARFCTTGSWVAIQGAKAATTTSSKATSRPARVIGLRSKWRSTRRLLLYSASTLDAGARSACALSFETVEDRLAIIGMLSM